LKFPKRGNGDVWNGKLTWSRLTQARVLSILKNPSYAGVYVYGRFQSHKTLSTEGSICSKIQTVPMSDWHVTIKDHHPGYISWEQFLHNNTILQQNRTNSVETLLPTAVREGLALLQGMLICSVCGRRLTVRYQGNGGLYPIYECSGRKRDSLATTLCMMFRCDLADQVISTRVLEVLTPEQFALAVKAMEQVEHRNEALDAQWRMRVQRAEYEASLAQRRYEEVDPANRLVASTLERRWNEALVNLEQVKHQQLEFRQTQQLQITPEQKQMIFALAKDLPRLWKAPTTQAKDRKRILRLLIKDITVEKVREPKKLILHVRWQGGAIEDLSCTLPAKSYGYSTGIVQKVRNLGQELTDDQIADALNREGLHSPKGGPFTKSKIHFIRWAYDIPAARLKRAEELTVKEVSQKFKVSQGVVYYWIEKGYLTARKVKKGSPLFITLRDGDEERLRRRVAESYKLNGTKATTSLQPDEGGVV
jgi:hypothetical protein